MRSLVAALLVCAAVPAAAAESGRVVIGMLSQARDPVPPVSPLDREIHDEGVAGARLGIADNNTTGRFTGQTFELVERVIERHGSAADAIRAFAAEGIGMVVADFDGPALLDGASAAEARALLILNVRAPDDMLREEDCRANLLHTIPSRAMLADAIAQYLVIKRWRRWFLVVGRHPEDKLYAEALRRAAKRFG